MRAIEREGGSSESEREGGGREPTYPRNSVHRPLSPTLQWLRATGEHGTKSRDSKARGWGALGCPGA